MPGRASSRTPRQDAGPRLEPADVALGLEYLTDFSVLVITDDVPEVALPAAIDAAGFAGAHVVLLVPPGRAVPALLPLDATVLAAPAEADEGEFGTLVGAYAAALDGGVSSREAFAVAIGDAGWEALAPPA